MADSSNIGQGSIQSGGEAGDDGGEERQHSTGHHRVKFSVDASDETQLPTHSPKKSLPYPRHPATSRPNRPHTPTLIDTDSADVTELSSTALGKEVEDVELSQQSAKGKARELVNRSASSSAPASRRSSFEDTTEPLLDPGGSQGYSVRADDIPLTDMKSRKDRRPYSSLYDSTDEDDENPEILAGRGQDRKQTHCDSKQEENELKVDAEARRLVRAMTGRLNLERTPARGEDRADVQNKQASPTKDRDAATDQSNPSTFKPGILSMLLKLSGQHDAAAALDRNSNTAPNPVEHQDAKSWRMHSVPKPHSSQPSRFATPGASSGSSGDNTPGTSGINTPKRPKWYDKSSRATSTSSLVGLLDASMMMGSPGAGDRATSNTYKPAAARPCLPRGGSTGALATLASTVAKLGPKPVDPDEVLITVHIAEVLSRQRYLLSLCRALMAYGAPTHRLEEYMRMSARTLQIDGQFLYIPGCMIVSFDDSNLHTTEVRIVKTAQGVDLGKFRDTFEIYKEVVHDKIGVEEAIQRLDEVMKRPDKFNVWVKILMYGCASAFVGPFAFSARPIDMPMAFVLGCVMGFLQLWVAPKSELYSNVLEITASIITSLAARGLGSITNKGSPIFCFSALAQSSIALILPGYIILCGSLELGTRNLVAGSVRMVYAIIYALMLGFGITIGTASYGLMHKNATSSVTCAAPQSLDWWNKNVVISRFPWVPLFTMCLIIINQAKWRQAPIMVLISFVGYQVNFWSAKRFANNVQIANVLGAFAVGVMGNLYSRLRHGLAAAAIIPAIFVQVPSGLAASGSLVSGLTSADQITGNATGISVISNGTQGFAEAQNGTAMSSGNNVYSGTLFNVGYGMIQVAIGISVGLFLSALIIYPFGKKRSGLFSF